MRLLEKKEVVTLVLILLALIAAVFFYFADFSGSVNGSMLKIGGLTVEVQIAETEQERAIGFSERSSLPANEGLLLVFDELDKHGIWMKDMKFSIDVVWLDENFKVVDLKENISPDTYPKIFTPDSPALYVLEINAGVSDEYGIKIGDKFELYTLFSNS